MTQAQQLPFDLGHRQAYEREDFWVSNSNKEAVTLLDRWPEWPAHALVLLGGKASGKTHLLQVWKQEAEAEDVLAEDLMGELLVKVASGYCHLAVDNAHQVVGNIEAERALLHLYNTLNETGKTMVMCFEKPIKEYDFIVPDLKSRLMAAPAAVIHPPDEELMAVVLTKMFSDRQIFVPQEVVEFIIPRIERSFSSISDVVEKLDQKSLERKKSVTIPLAKEVLQI